MAKLEEKYLKLIKLLKAKIPESRLITNDLLLSAYGIPARSGQSLEQLIFF